MKTLSNGLLMAALLTLIGAQNAAACATCFGKSDAPLAQGMNMGILALLGFIGVVLGGLVCFFVYVAKRTAAYEADQERETTSNEFPTDND